MRIAANIAVLGPAWEQRRRPDPAGFLDLGSSRMGHWKTLGLACAFGPLSPLFSTPLPDAGGAPAWVSLPSWRCRAFGGFTTKHQKKGRVRVPGPGLAGPRGVQEPRHRQDSVCSMSEGALDTSDPRNSQGLAGLAGEGAKPLRVNFLCFWPITHLELCVFGAFLHASR